MQRFFKVICPRCRPTELRRKTRLNLCLRIALWKIGFGPETDRASLIPSPLEGEGEDAFPVLTNRGQGPLRPRRGDGELPQVDRPGAFDAERLDREGLPGPGVADEAE